MIMPTAKKIKSRGNSRNWLWGLLVLVLLAILIFLTFENFKVAHKREKLQNELKVLENKIAELNGESEALQSKIFQSDDTKYLERVAREELNLKKEGESVVAFPVLEEKAQEHPKDLEQQTLWQKIMDKIR